MVVVLFEMPRVSHACQMSSLHAAFYKTSVDSVAGDCLGLCLNLDEGFIVFMLNGVPVCIFRSSK
jgi:hypothetical protein